MCQSRSRGVALESKWLVKRKKKRRKKDLQCAYMEGVGDRVYAWCHCPHGAWYRVYGEVQVSWKVNC